MNPAPQRRWPFSQRTLFVVATALVAGFVVGFFAVVLQEHHGMPWVSVLTGAPVNILARLIFDHGEVYAWSKIVGTGFLYALYAHLLSDKRVKGAWKYVLGIHGACAVFLAWGLLKG